MLEADEDKRISMRDVEAHPWCTRPLESSSPLLAAKLRRLRERQAALAAGNGLPRYLARDGNALIHQVVQRALRARAPHHPQPPVPAAGTTRGLARSLRCFSWCLSVPTNNKFEARCRAALIT